MTRCTCTRALAGLSRHVDSYSTGLLRASDNLRMPVPSCCNRTDQKHPLYVFYAGIMAEVADTAVKQEDGAMDVDAPSTSANNKPRFEIKKWNAVAMWSWEICTDTCAICRNNLYEPSIDYSANPTGDPDHPGLSIAWGACGHVFHLDCIQRWLKARSACPLCNKDWEYAKIEKILPGGGADGGGGNA